jgi:hypothetical protein
MGLASLGLGVAVSLHSALLFSAIVKLDVLGLALSWTQVGGRRCPSATMGGATGGASDGRGCHFDAPHYTLYFVWRQPDKM